MSSVRAVFLQSPFWVHLSQSGGEWKGYVEIGPIFVVLWWLRCVIPLLRKVIHSRKETGDEWHSISSEGVVRLGSAVYGFVSMLSTKWQSHYSKRKRIPLLKMKRSASSHPVSRWLFFIMQILIWKWDKLKSLTGRSNWEGLRIPFRRSKKRMRNCTLPWSRLYLQRRIRWKCLICDSVMCSAILPAKQARKRR